MYYFIVQANEKFVEVLHVSEDKYLPVDFRQAVQRLIDGRSDFTLLDGLFRHLAPICELPRPASPGLFCLRAIVIERVIGVPPPAASGLRYIYRVRSRHCDLSIKPWDAAPVSHGCLRLWGLRTSRYSQGGFLIAPEFSKGRNCGTVFSLDDGSAALTRSAMISNASQ